MLKKPNVSIQQKRYLFLTDFDGTLFDTFTKSPNGIGVREAYTKALDLLFGKQVRDRFLANGGTFMDTPSQIIEKIMDGEDREFLLDSAKRFLEKDGKNDKNIISGDGDLLQRNMASSFAEVLVDNKLNILLGEIGKPMREGTTWPCPMKGAVDFVWTVQNLKQEGVPIDFGIVSSGHTAFIKKAMRLWDIPLPDILVTEDDIRPRKYPTESERRFKPGPFPFALAHEQWMNLWDSKDRVDFVDTARESRQRILYIGDDLGKDARAAELNNLGAFFLFPENSFRDISLLMKRRKELFDGRPVNQIMNMERFVDREVYQISGQEQYGNRREAL